MSNHFEGHNRCPVDFTCPQIDEAIRLVEECMSINFDHTDVIHVVQQLEELREVNTTLREWGCAEAKDVDSLKEQVHDLVGDL